MAVPTARVRFKRPKDLESTTYQIRPGSMEGAMYVTICDGIHCDQKRPVEIWINSASMQNFEYISALMRVISSCLQQPGDFPIYLVEDLLSTYDTSGGYFVTSGQIGERSHCPSVVSHIGKVIEHHCLKIGVLEKPVKVKGL